MENTEEKGPVEIPLGPFAAVFFLSGAAALVYQVVWQRILVFFTGADVYASTIIVAVFMAGLGVGAWAGGRLADRLSARMSALLFAGAELGIAAFSLVSRPLFYDVLYRRLGPLDLAPGVLIAILFGSLLVPTLLMGMSLPLLTRALTARLEQAAQTVGRLYAVNTLGAAVGAMAATWWILPELGLAGALYAGTAMNVVCAVSILPFRQRLSDATPSRLLNPTAGAEASPAYWIAAYAVSGFIALSLEILWFRLLGVMVKSTAFTFGSLLATYLFGLGIGALAGSRIARTVRRPAVLFLLLQAAASLSAAALLILMVGAVSHVEWLHAYFASYDPLNVAGSLNQLRSGFLPSRFLFLYFGLPAVLIAVPTLFMGVSFPVLQRIVQTDFARLGRRVAYLLLANILGSVLGAVLTGWLALDLLGTSRTMSLLACLGGAFLIAAAIQRFGRNPIPACAALAVTAVIAWSVPDSERLWGRLHGTSAGRMIVGEDATGLSVLRLESDASPVHATVFVNGVGQSTVPFGGVHTGLGMVPVLLHPAPQRIAIIGLGSGDTVHAAAARPETQEIFCIEIVGSQLPGLRRLRDRLQYPALTGLLQDPRITWLTGDGRVFLMRETARFDVIEADALRPTSAYSGNLYSVEYFELLRSRLRPGGLAATWLPTERVHNAFVRVFPHVVSVPGILVGSNDPIPLDRELIARRLADPRVRDYYERAGIDADALMAEYLENPAVYTPGFDRSSLLEVNTDLFPRDEFDLSGAR